MRQSGGPKAGYRPASWRDRRLALVGRQGLRADFLDGVEKGAVAFLCDEFDGGYQAVVTPPGTGRELRLALNIPTTKRAWKLSAP